MSEPSDTHDDVAQNGEKSWLKRLSQGLSRSAKSLNDSVNTIFFKRKLDALTLEELEDALISADLGLETAAEIVEEIGTKRYEKEISPDEVRAIMRHALLRILKPVEQPLIIDGSHKPFVILVAGVNGAGKTTTIGKLAKQWRAQGKRVMLAAGDTFRAAAIEQLKVWGSRVDAPVIAGAQGADAAGLSYEAYEKAREQNMDVLIIDTAGRLQNREDLMSELAKIARVLKKFDASAPHASILVLDATTGQNAVNQVEVFRQIAQITGLIMTKLDGTAKGGILVSIARRFGLPVYAIGVGEGVDDLQPFDAQAFARALTEL